MAMTEADIQCELSYAYLHAVAARLGVECDKSERISDNHAVDARLHVVGKLAADYVLARLSVDIQLKSCSRDLVQDDARFSYPPPRVQYDKLRATDVNSPLLLVLFVMPHDSGAVAIAGCRCFDNAQVCLLGQPLRSGAGDGRYTYRLRAQSECGQHRRDACVSWGGSAAGRRCAMAIRELPVGLAKTIVSQDARQYAMATGWRRLELPVRDSPGFFGRVAVFEAAQTTPTNKS